MRVLYHLLTLALLGVVWGNEAGEGSTESASEANLVEADSPKMMFLGYPLMLSCNITSLGSAFTLDWYKNDILLESSDRVKIFPDNSSLLIPNPDKDDVGDYECRTSTDGILGEPISKTIRVIYLSIRHMSKAMVVSEGENLELECPVDGAPTPGIEWLKDRLPIRDAVNESQISFLPNKYEMPEAKLVIRDVNGKQRGNFSCIITSPNQKYERHTYVRVKSVYAFLWPFLGIVVEMVVLGVIIFIFEKRRAKAEYDESDTDQGNDQPPPSSPVDDDLAHVEE